MVKGEVHIQDGKLVISRGDVNLPPTLRRVGRKDLQHPYFWPMFTMIGISKASQARMLAISNHLLEKIR